MPASKPPLTMRLVSCGSGSAEVVVDWATEVIVGSAEAVNRAEVVEAVDSAVVDSVLSVEAEDRVAEVVTVSLAETVVDSVVRTVALSVEAVDRAEEVVTVVGSVEAMLDSALLSVEAVDIVSEEAKVVPLRDEEVKGGKHGEANTPRAKANSGSANISDLMVNARIEESSQQ